MKTQTISVKDIYRIANSDSKPEHANPSEKITLVIVGVCDTENLFEKFGEHHAEQLLELFRDIVSHAIVENGGNILKSENDRLWSGFDDAAAAVETCITIHNEVLEHNRKATARERFRIRSGVHFGPVFLENGEIFGSTEEKLSRIFQSVDPGEIRISREIAEMIREHSALLLEIREAAPSGKGQIDFPVFIVSEKDNSSQLQTETLYSFIKPVWKIASDEFIDSWNDITSKEFGSELDNKKIFPDKSLCFFSTEILPLIKKTEHFIESVHRTFSSREQGDLLPVQIIIGFHQGSKTDFQSDSIHVNWEKLYPGVIYISRKVYSGIRENDAYSTKPAFQETESKQFYQLIKKSQEIPNNRPYFSYRGMLVKGFHPPCFYCGNRVHTPINCPSKRIGDILPRVSERFGYMKFSEINRTFFDFLITNDVSTSGVEANQQNASAMLGQRGFFELNLIFQLRFIKAVWRTEERDWNKIKKKKSSGRIGGRIWLAFDCIRISDHKRAEEILNSAMRETPYDYKIYCALGLLHMERNDTSKALYFLTQARYYAEKIPQQILSLFLIFRLHEVKGNTLDAEKQINEIVSIYPRCPEARYFSAIYAFRKGNLDEGKETLTELIQIDREFYFFAMIDPALKPWEKLVLGILEDLFQQAAEDAEGIIPNAENALEKQKALFGDDDPEIREGSSLLKRMRDLMRMETYFGYLDVFRFGDIIVSRGERIIQERKKQRFEEFREIRSDVRNRLDFLDKLPMKNFVSRTYEELVGIQNDIRGNMDRINAEMPGSLKGNVSPADEFRNRIQGIDAKIRSFTLMLKLRSFLMTFLVKLTPLNLLINLFLCAIVFPAITRLAFKGYSDMSLIAMYRELWPFIRGFLITGFGFGAILCFLIAFNKIYSNSDNAGET